MKRSGIMPLSRVPHLLLEPEKADETTVRVSEKDEGDQKVESSEVCEEKISSEEIKQQAGEDDNSYLVRTCR